MEMANWHKEELARDAGDMEVESAARVVESDFVGCIDHSADDLGSLEPSFDDFVAELLLTQMGGSGKQRGRERRTAARKIVSEIYSPPRITKLIRELRPKHVMPGFSFDITVLDPDDGMPWDFSIPEKRAKARRKLREQKPYLLVGSPMCTQFSTWQYLNEHRSTDKAGMRRAKIAAIVHLDFVASLYEEQIAGARYFLHEHPLHATSWSVPSIEALLRMPQVQLASGDQCQFGAEARSGPMRGQPIKKPSGFLTNSNELFEILSKRCNGNGGDCSRPGGGRHVVCSGRRAIEAAQYPRGLCKAVLR